MYESNHDILIARTTNLRHNLVIVSVYFPPSVKTNDFKMEMERLLLCIESYKNVILMGDFNARNTIWGDGISSRRGSVLEELIMETTLKSCNNGKITFKRNMFSAGSVLDLTFISADLSGRWDVSEGYLGGSRHFPILLELDTFGLGLKKFLAKNKLIEALNNTELEPNFDSIHETISNEIKYATFVLEGNRAPKYWWNNNLTVLFRKQLAATKKANKYPSYDNLEMAVCARRLWKAEVQNSKNKSLMNLMRCQILEAPGGSSIILKADVIRFPPPGMRKKLRII